MELVVLDRPDRLNVLDGDAIAALARYFEALRDRPDIRVVLVSGSGRAFCAGMDLDAWQTLLAGAGAGEIAAFQASASGLIRAMRAAPQPLVGLGHGFACGIGFAILLACDIVFGTPDLSMNVASVRIGLGGADVGISWLLPRKVGQARAAELMLTGRMVPAEEGAAIGLLHDIVEPGRLVEAGLAKASEIARNAPLGVRYTKSALDAAAVSLEAAMAIEDRQQVLLAGTADHREAVAAFAGKREPVFTGR